jgi:hypothetical protein
MPSIFFYSGGIRVIFAIYKQLGFDQMKQNPVFSSLPKRVNLLRIGLCNFDANLK